MSRRERELQNILLEMADGLRFSIDNMEVNGLYVRQTPRPLYWLLAPLIRSRIPTIVERVTTLITPGENVDVLVTEYGIAVNPRRPDVAARLSDAGLRLTTIEDLYGQALRISGKPGCVETTDEIVGIVRYRDGSVMDVVRAVAG